VRVTTKLQPVHANPHQRKFLRSVINRNTPVVTQYTNTTDQLCHLIQKASDLAPELCPHSRALCQQPVNINEKLCYPLTQLKTASQSNANDTRTRNRYRKPVPENLYRFSAGVSRKSVSIFSGTEIWYGVEQCFY